MTAAIQLLALWALSVLPLTGAQLTMKPWHKCAFSVLVLLLGVIAMVGMVTDG